MKIYARQVAPEYQESPLFMGAEMWPDNITITGNRNFNAHETPLFGMVYHVLESGELAEILDDLKKGGAYYGSCYKNATEAITDYLTPERGRYSTRAIHALKELVKHYTDCARSEENGIICQVLSIVADMEYDWKSLTGSCQGEWVECFFPVKEWSREALDALETEYFNTGTEWIIHDEDGEPDGPEEISGYSMYCVSWNDEGIKEEIAGAAGGDPADVVLYKFVGWTRSPEYGEAC